ncbi:MAG: riboflavin biosynthesis protein RibF [Actinobacteria bacterium HGW-Actinobacteria-7]|jgi:riboflavin kinase/FMN adenylyltransferase|nr:MAG: riboflavin biosynthesis protein RibF [Actinobacteria bacterium HGW-Actinobacteria-7]
MRPLGRACVAIGVFDGVHRGHQELLDQTLQDARNHGARAIAVTFDRDPDQVVTPETAAPQLLRLEDKIDAILAHGMSVVLVVPFTAQMAATGAEEFLDEVLGQCCEVVSVHVGKDFRFGRGASGDLDTLYVWGIEHNIDVVGHSLLEVQGHPVSSTRIRGLIAVGDIASAMDLLGYAPRLTGVVVHGRGEGTALGFATANVEPDEFSALPASGVYAGIAQLQDGTRWAAAISVGVPPTFPQASDYLEAHIIDYAGDLYGQRVTLDFYRRLRDQEHFDSFEALKAQIGRDISATIDLVCENRNLEC